MDLEKSQKTNESPTSLNVCSFIPANNVTALQNMIEFIGNRGPYVYKSIIFIKESQYILRVQSRTLY